MKTFYDFLLEAPQPPTGSPPAGGPPPAGGLGGPPPGGGLGGPPGGPPPAGGLGGPPGGPPPAVGLGGPQGGANPDLGGDQSQPQSQVKIQTSKSVNVWQALEKILGKNGQNSKKMV